MTDYTWPTSIVPSATEWRLVSSTAAFTSPLSGTTRTLSRGGDRWMCLLQVNNLTDDNRAILQAFLARLRGQVHRVILPDHSFYRRGTDSHSILTVDGTNSVGSSTLALRGMDLTKTGAVKAGDWLTVHQASAQTWPAQTVMVTADANTDGSGETSTSIVPPLRLAFSDGQWVTANAPTFRMLLTGQTVGWSNEPRGYGRSVSSFSLEFMEDLL